MSSSGPCAARPAEAVAAMPSTSGNPAQDVRRMDSLGVADGTPDLTLLDLMMAGMDDLTTLRHLWSQPAPFA